MNNTSVKRLGIDVLKLKVIFCMEPSKGFDVLFAFSFPIFLDFNSAYYFPLCFHLFKTKLHSPNTEGLAVLISHNSSLWRTANNKQTNNTIQLNVKSRKKKKTPLIELMLYTISSHSGGTSIFVSLYAANE